MTEGATSLYENGDNDKLVTMYSSLCQNIKNERARLGAENWVVACGIPTKKLRDFVRSNLDQVDLSFIILDIPKDLLQERLLSRQDGFFYRSTMYAKADHATELSGPDEPDCLNIHVTKSMTDDEIYTKVKAFAFNTKSFTEKEPLKAPASSGGGFFAKLICK